MEQFPGNSQKARVPDEPKKIERVTSAKVGRGKRRLGKQFKETFVTGDDARGVMEYVIIDIIVPEIKDLFVDVVQSGIERWVHGGDNRRVRRGRIPSTTYDNVGRVAYDSISRGPYGSSRQSTTTQPQRTMSRPSRARHRFDELIIPTRQEAEEVIDRMFDILSRYGSVSVADLYELTGVQSSHTDMKWGWTQLRGAKAVPVRRQGGFLLDLPEPESLD